MSSIEARGILLSSWRTHSCVPLRRLALSHIGGAIVAPCGAVPLDCARPPGRAPVGQHAALNSLVAAPPLCGAANSGCEPAFQRAQPGAARPGPPSEQDPE